MLISAVERPTCRVLVQSSIVQMESRTARFVNVSAGCSCDRGLAPQALRETYADAIYRMGMRETTRSAAAVRKARKRYSHRDVDRRWISR